MNPQSALRTAAALGFLFAASGPFLAWLLNAPPDIWDMLWVETIAIAVVSYGVARGSRFCAVAVLLYYIASRLASVMVMGPVGIVMTLVMLRAFIGGVQAAFIQEPRQ